MRICHIATFWPNRFGHTHYIDALIQGMRAHQRERHIVAAEFGSTYRDAEDIHCMPCFSRRADYVEDIAAAVRATRAEVALIQYSNDVFGEDNRFPRLVRRLREAGVITVVNPHSVYPPAQATDYRPGRTCAAFDLAVAQEASCVMVHSARMRQDLLMRGVAPDQIVVIPHGSRAMEQRDQRESRRQLGLPEEARVVLFFGFIWLGKGLDFLLDVFARVARRVPDAYLYIGGYTRHRLLYTRLYMAYLRGRMYQLGIARRTLQWGSYVPDEVVPTIYAAGDVVAMPYRQDYSSVSGVVHQTSGVGKLMLCSRIAKFDEVEQLISPELVVEPEDLHGWEEGLVKLLTDELYAEAMRARIRQFAVDTSWEAVGRMHLNLYRALLNGQAPASAVLTAG